MAWYNSIRDLGGDLNDLAHLRNPMNNDPVRGAPPTAGIGTTNTSNIPKRPQTGSYMTDDKYNNPLDPGNFETGGSSGAGGGDQSKWDDMWGFVKSHAGDIAGAVADFAKEYGMTLLEAYNVYNAANRAKDADSYAKDALAGATKRFDVKEPLRVAGQSGMLNPSANTPDLSNIRQISTAGSGNPFARALPVSGVATKPPGYDSMGKLNTPATPGGTLPVANPPVTPAQPPVMGGPLPVQGEGMGVLTPEEWARRHPTPPPVTGAPPARPPVLPVGGGSPGGIQDENERTRLI